MNVRQFLLLLVHGFVPLQNIHDTKLVEFSSTEVLRQSFHFFQEILINLILFYFISDFSQFFFFLSQFLLFLFYFIFPFRVSDLQFFLLL